MAMNGFQNAAATAAQPRPPQVQTADLFLGAGGNGGGGNAPRATNMFGGQGGAGPATGGANTLPAGPPRAPGVRPGAPGATRGPGVAGQPPGAAEAYRQAIQAGDPAAQASFRASLQNDPRAQAQMRAAIQAKQRAQGPGGQSAATPGFQAIMDNQFGAGNPFGDVGGNPLAWGNANAVSGMVRDPRQGATYGPDPIAAANEQAQAFLDKNLSSIGGQFGGAGTPNSARSMLERGSAVGAAAAGLGTGLAAEGSRMRAGDLDRSMQGGLGMTGFGLQQQQGNLDRAMTGQLGAGQQQLAASQQQIDAMNALGQQGQMLNQMGALEQQIPNAGVLLSLLGLFPTTGGQGLTQQGSDTVSGLLAA